MKDQRISSLYQHVVAAVKCTSWASCSPGSSESLHCWSSSATGQSLVNHWSSTGQGVQLVKQWSAAAVSWRHQLLPLHTPSTSTQSTAGQIARSLSLSWRQLLPEEQWSVAAAAILAALPSADQRPPAPVVPLGYRADHRPPANGCPAPAAPSIPLASIQGSSYPR